jgi:hypothetical protein
MASEADLVRLKARVRVLEQALEPFARAYVPPPNGCLQPGKKLIVHLDGRHLERAWRLLRDHKA